jgi:hypothetical protein
VIERSVAAAAAGAGGQQESCVIRAASNQVLDQVRDRALFFLRWCCKTSRWESPSSNQISEMVRHRVKVRMEEVAGRPQKKNSDHGPKREEVSDSVESASSEPDDDDDDDDYDF